MERCCGTCKWHWYENIDEGFVCTNIDSEYCADWTDYADSCEDWEGKDDEELAEVFCDADWCNACGQLKQDGTCRAMEMGGELDTYCKAGCLTWLRQSAVEEAR